MSGALRIELALTGGADQRLESPRFVAGGSSSFSRQREVLAARIDRVGAVLRRDQPFIREPPQRLVEGAGRRVEPAAGLRLDVLADGVAVGGPVAERQQDVEGQIRERAWLGMRHVGRLDGTGRPNVADNCSSSYAS